MNTKRTVAIVDDDAAIRNSAAMLLQRVGYTVRTFESGDAFLAANLPGDADIILLDLFMQGTDGFGVLQALGDRQSMPPVVVLTGRGAIPEAVEAMKLGASDFLEKPCPPEELLEAIGRAVAAGPRRMAGAVDAEAASRIAGLSPRQADVLRGVLKGQPNKITAHQLGLSIRSVEAYRAELLKKLGVRGTAEAVRLAIAAGMLESG